MRTRGSFDRNLSPSSSLTADRKNIVALQSRESTAGVVSVTASCTTRSAKDLISDVRYAANSLFIQRTRDLTCNEALQERISALTEELGTLQCLYSNLAVEQAKIDAALEEAHQKQKERSEALKGVHAAMLQITDDQQLCSKVFKTTERVTHAVNGFIYEVINGGFDSPTSRGNTGTRSGHTAITHSQVISSPSSGSTVLQAEERCSQECESLGLDNKQGMDGGNSHPSLPVALSTLMYNSHSFIQGRTAEDFRQVSDAIRLRTTMVKQSLEEMRLGGKCTSSYATLIFRMQKGMKLCINDSESEECSSHSSMGSQNMLELHWEAHHELQPIRRLLTFMESLGDILEKQWKLFVAELSSPFPSRTRGECNNTPLDATVLSHFVEEGDTSEVKEGVQGECSPLWLLFWHHAYIYDTVLQTHISSYHTEEKEKSTSEINVKNRIEALEQEGHMSTLLNSCCSFPSREKECVHKFFFPCSLGFFFPFLSSTWVMSSLIPNRFMDFPSSLFPSLPSCMDETNSIQVLQKMRLSFENTEKKEWKEKEQSGSKNEEAGTMSCFPFTLKDAGKTESLVDKRCYPLNERDEKALIQGGENCINALISAEQADSENTETETHSISVSLQNRESQCALPSSSSSVLSSSVRLSVPTSSMPHLPDIHNPILCVLCILARRIETLSSMSEEVHAQATAIGIEYRFDYAKDFQEELAKEARSLIEKSITFAEVVSNLCCQRRVLEDERKVIQNSLLPTYEKVLTKVAALEEILQETTSQPLHAPLLGQLEPGEGSTQRKGVNLIYEEEKNHTGNEENNHNEEGDKDSSATTFLSSAFSWLKMWKSLTSEYPSFQEKKADLQRMEEAFSCAKNELSKIKQASGMLSDACAEELHMIQVEIEKEEALHAEESKARVIQEKDEEYWCCRENRITDLQYRLSEAVGRVTSYQQHHSPLVHPSVRIGTCPQDHSLKEKRERDDASLDMTGRASTSGSLSSPEELLGIFTETELDSIYSSMLSLSSLLPPSQQSDISLISAPQMGMVGANEEKGKKQQPFAILTGGEVPLSKWSSPPLVEHSVESLSTLADSLFETFADITPLLRSERCEQQTSPMDSNVAAATLMSSLSLKNNSKDEKNIYSSSSWDESTALPVGAMEPPCSNSPSPSSHFFNSSLMEENRILPPPPSEEEVESKSKPPLVSSSAEASGSLQFSAPIRAFLSPSLLYQTPIYQWVQKDWERRTNVSSFFPSSPEVFPKESIQELEEEKGGKRQPHMLENKSFIDGSVFSFFSSNERDRFLQEMFLGVGVSPTSKMVMELLCTMISTEMNYRHSTEMFEKYKFDVLQAINDLHSQLA